MSDTPTFASLLTQWSGGDFAERRSVYRHLKENPAEAAALEASIRDELTASLPWKRIIAAEAMLEVYCDQATAAESLRGVLRQGDSAAAFDTIDILKKLSPPFAGPLLAEFAFHAPGVFRAQPHEFLCWAGATAIQSGDEGPLIWLGLLGSVGAEWDSPLLMGLADAAPCATCDLSGVELAVRSRLFHTGPGYAAGAALWRLTWRVNRDWLASIKSDSEQLRHNSPLLVLLISVLTEHLGRRSDLAPLIRELLIRLAHDHPELFPTILDRLANLGGRGWSVLLPVLGDTTVNAETRTAVFNEVATRPALLLLAHHHAHGVILNRKSFTLRLLEAAASVLRAIEAQAGSALADILNLIAQEPDTAPAMVSAIPAIAPGYPNSVAAVARTLDRLRRSSAFRADSFAALAAAYATMSLDGAPLLAEDTSFDPRTPDLLLQQPAWKNAAPEVRRKHAMTLADRFASSRPEVRARAAELLHHYPDQMPAVWAALVAALVGSDEKVAQLVLPYFRHLTSVADTVTAELTLLFREPNPTYAARAVVALWRLGRMPAVTEELLAAVLDTTNDSWGWAVLRGVVDRTFQSHSLLNDLSQVFAASPPEVAAKVQAMLTPPESPEDAAISAHVQPENFLRRVDWNGVYQCVGNDSEGGFLFLALMCAYGSAGFSGQKIWMIKHQRMAASTGLAEAKGIVERAIERLTSSAAPGDKRSCVRDYFPHSVELPKALTDLLVHRLSWYRWAGLELLDAWDDPRRLPELLEDRIWDRSALVRTRALRMHQG